jgi:hypothetical protein
LKSERLLTKMAMDSSSSGISGLLWPFVNHSSAYSGFAA